MDDDSLKYPIGRFQPPEHVTRDEIDTWIADIEQAPEALRQAVAGLSEAQLDTPYRPDGWTVRQVVHHLPDAHMPTYVRFRMALTADSPQVSGYDVDAWARLADARTAPVAPSLALFEALHNRWAYLLKSMSDEDFTRTVTLQSGISRPIGLFLGIYAWHGKHHVAHITELRRKSGW